jgi:hypothetical protein
LPLRRIPKRESAAFPTDWSDTFPSPTSLVSKIYSGLRLAYRAGDGSAAIFDSMLVKSRLAGFPALQLTSFFFFQIFDDLLWLGNNLQDSIIFFSNVCGHTPISEQAVPVVPKEEYGPL